MPSDLDLRKLRYFVALAEELNFGRAADRLHLAQPVLTRQIRSLEADLGVQLFDRDTRGTTLTESGASLLQRARELLASAAALRNELAPVRVVRVGVMPGLLVTAAVAAFERAVPGSQVELHRVGWDDQIVVLHERRLDLVYAREPFDHSELSTMFLLDEPRLAALPATHPLASAESVVMDELRSTLLLQNPDAVPEWSGSATPELVRRARKTIPPNTVEEKLESVASGRGFVVLPESTASFYRRPDVVVIPIADLPPNRVTLAWLTAATDAAIGEFVAAAVGHPPATPT